MAKLFEVAEARGEKRANAIFFLGLGGDADITWLADKAHFWPAWLAEDIEGLSVFCVDYGLSVSNWHGSAMELADRAANVLNLLLVKAELGTGEVILAGHSLDGLVIKQLLRKAADAAIGRAEALSFIDRVRKVAFLATPDVGALVRPLSATPSLIRNDQHLRDLNLWYGRWARERNIDHLILTATKTTSMFGMLVKPDSADPGLGTNPVLVDAYNTTIVKPANRESEIYQLVRDFIERHAERPVSHEERRIDAVKNDTAIREIVERLTAEISKSNAEALAEELAKVKAEYGVTVDLISRFLEALLGRRVPPDQFAMTLYKIVNAWRASELNPDEGQGPRLARELSEAGKTINWGTVPAAISELSGSRRPKFIGFFSYSHTDAKVDPKVVNAFYTELEERVDASLINATFEIWRDKEKLRVGDYWDQKIKAAIKGSHVFILLLTPKWISSDYCRKEFETFETGESARGAGGYVIPIYARGRGRKVFGTRSNELISSNQAKAISARTSAKIRTTIKKRTNKPNR